jgi:periplasmic protein TonB
MKTTLQNQASYLDIVFAGRNKSYGAYDLRKSYTNSLQKAISVILGISTVIALFAFTNKPNSVVLPTIFNKPTILTPVNIFNPKIPSPAIPVKPHTTQAHNHTINDKNLAIVKILPTVNEVPKVPGIAASTGSEGPIINGPIGEPSPKESGGSGPAAIATVTAVSANIETTSLDINPSFPGGELALKSFLERNIQYPEEAINDGVEGTIKVAFEINEKGELSAIKILNKIGAGCDEEAKRVLKMMPKWNPGIYNGKPVSSRWEIPMSFKLK